MKVNINCKKLLVGRIEMVVVAVVVVVAAGAAAVVVAGDEDNSLKGALDHLFEEIKIK